MHNRWHVAKDSEFHWYATVPANTMSELRQVAVRAGAELEVHRTGPDGVSSLVAVADRDGEIVERHVSDLAEVLAAAPYHPDYLQFLRHRPPLRVTQLFDTTLAISSYSDIWLPWTVGWYEPDHEHGYWADNHPLANRHTPRLNEFLARVRAATLSLGGSWEVDWMSTSLDIRFQLDGLGVRLDAEDRMVRGINVYLGNETLTATLRWGLRQLGKRRPAPSGYRNALQVFVEHETHELHTQDRATLLAALRQVDVRIADLMEVDLIEFVTRTHGFTTVTVDEILAG